MKTALVATEKLPVPPVRGGAVQTYMSGVIPFLSKRYEITAFCCSDPELPRHEIKDGVEYVRLDAQSPQAYVGSVAAAMKGRSFDLVEVFNRPRFVRLLAETNPEARFVLSLHNEMFMPDKISPEEALWVLDRVAAVVSVSNFIRDGVIERYPMALPKSRTIYSGVDPGRFLPRWDEKARERALELRAEYNLGSGPVILFVGRLSDKKGPHVLIQAMQFVVRRQPRAVLLLVGSKWFGDSRVDSYGHMLQTLASRVSARVIFTGYVPSDQVQEYFWAADILVCPSQWQEPLARVHYEAMAAGVPIVTTRRGGNPEVVTGMGTGLTVEEFYDPEAIAAAILHILDDPAAAEAMGRRGRELAVTRFSWDRVAEELASVFDEALSGEGLQK